jgi:pimeloyl-ACP methyl ester carboxylesterase
MQKAEGRGQKWLLFFCLLHSAFCIPASAQPVGKLVDIGGRKLHIVCMGSGSPTVVMESGAAEGFYSWWLVQQKLRDEVRTCSYDRAGFGWSDPTPSRSVSGYADDLHALLAAAGEKPPFILVGHSLGGSFVQRYYWKYPNDVAAIIAVDPANNEASFPPFDAYREVAAKYRAKRTKEMEEWRATDKWPKQSFPSQLPRDLRERLIAASASRNWWEARFAEGSLPDLTVAMTPEQRRVGVPLVVIIATKSDKPPDWSDETFAQYRQRARAMDEEIVSRSKEGKLVEAPTSHSVQLDDPGLVANEIRRIRMRVAAKETP